jgi:excisionase family DNA binding protein
MSTKIEVSRQCEYCGDAFTAKTTVTRYCSHKCNQRHYKQRKRNEKLKTHEQQQKVVQLQLPEADFGALDQKAFLSIKETAVLLGLSERTLYRLMAEGTLPSHKVGRRTILKREDINGLFGG